MSVIHQGDCVEVMAGMEADSVHCCVTSPPYWSLRDYGVEGQLGLEPTPEEYVERMVAVFREVWRVLRDDGTLWLNLGDSYNAQYRGGGFDTASDKQRSNFGTADFMATKARMVTGLKPKDLVGIPWRVAFALQADGWYLRSDIIWAKPNPMPESVRDRPTKAHEYVFLLSKQARYWYDAEAIAEASCGAAEYPKRHGNGESVCGPGGAYRVGSTTSGRNRRTVWTIATQPYPEAHFATFPEKLVEPCVLAGCPVGGTVLDPFCGSGTTGVVAARLGREFIGIELNPEYVAMAKRRIAVAEAQQRLPV
jgi:DNA modification methylase